MFSETLINLINKHGKTVYSISKSTGISESLLSRYKSGQIKPSSKNLGIIANYFNVSVDYLINEENLQSYPALSCKAAESVFVPLYGSVSAEELLGYEVFDKTSLPSNKLEDYFCLVIKGDCMAPQLIEGDVVLIKRQEDASSGEIVLAAVKGEEASVKKIKKGKDYIELIPYNPAYESLLIEGRKLKEVQIVGVVAELRRRF